MSENLRAAVIGIGSMGRHHARVLRSTPGVELVALMDPEGDKFNVAQGLEVYADIQSTLKRGIDLAVLAVPTKWHHKIALQLAEAKVHTLVEKPLANSFEEGVEIRDAFAQAHLVGAVGFVERCNASLQKLRQLLQEGFLGDIYQISTRRQGPFPARINDVGVIKDLATHDVDIAYWLSDSSFASVSAFTKAKSGRDVEDMVIASGMLKNGIIVNHVVNWLSPFKERVTAVTGQRGTLVANTLHSELRFFANGTMEIQWDQMAAFKGVSEGDVTRYALAQREPLQVEANNFVAAIRGEGKDHASMDAGLLTLQGVEAILTSADSGKTVVLD